MRGANNGTDRLELASEFQPDVILLDIGLPDLDGYEAARRLRKKDELVRVPLIAISGFSSETDRSRADRAGFDRFVVKPIEMASHAAGSSRAGTRRGNQSVVVN